METTTVVMIAAMLGVALSPPLSVLPCACFAPTATNFLSSRDGPRPSRTKSRSCEIDGDICLFFAPALCSPVPVLLFCQCGSDRVDVHVWNGRLGAQLRCLTRSHEAWLDGFTVSEFDPAKLLTAAIVDQVRKHRKRPPEEVARVQSERALNRRRG